MSHSCRFPVIARLATLLSVALVSACATRSHASDEYTVAVASAVAPLDASSLPPSAGEPRPVAPVRVVVPPTTAEIEATVTRVLAKREAEAAAANKAREHALAVGRAKARAKAAARRRARVRAAARAEAKRQAAGGVQPGQQPGGPPTSSQSTPQPAPQPTNPLGMAPQPAQPTPGGQPSRAPDPNAGMAPRGQTPPPGAAPGSRAAVAILHCKDGTQQPGEIGPSACAAHGGVAPR
jgi:hypothetical protein